MSRRIGALTIGLLLAAAGVALAQATATLNGRIIDQGGATLPGVTVTVTNTATGVIRETVTNTEGLYNFPAMDRGSYAVKAELTGFAPQSRNLELTTGTTLTVDLQLGLAGLQETLTVSAQAPLVESTQATLANSIRQAEVVQLPMLNRSMAAIMTLLPGAREVPVSAATAHGQASNWVSFGGGGGRNYNMLVDGVDNKEDHCGGSGVSYSLEGVQEFKVLSTGSSAEYGKGSTSVLVATKSGTNQLRGSVFGYGRNQDLVKIDYFSEPENGGAGKQPFSRGQYGGSIGGPIVQNRAFFFGSLERVQQDFNVPRSQLAQTQLQYLVPLDIGVQNGAAINQPSRDLQMQAKLNLTLNATNSVFVRWAGQRGYVDNDAVGPTTSLLDYAPYSDRNRQRLDSVAAGWTWIASPTMVNLATVQYYSFTHDNQYPACPLAQGCLIQHLVFPSVSTSPVTGGGFPDWFNWENKWQFRDDLSKQIGRHAIKVGADYSRLPKFGGIFGSASPGQITFFDDPSVIFNNTNGLYPQGIATPGAARQIQVTSTPIGDYSSFGNWALGAYVQDDFRMSSRVTLNLGLRYDVYDYMNTQNFAANRTYQILNAIGSPYGQLPKIDKNNLGPRAGLAWDLRGDGRDVVRGSYGRFYMSGIKNSYFQRAYIEQPTIFINSTTTNTAVGVGQLANYAYGISPLPPQAVNPTQFPSGASSVGAWYDPNLQDFQTDQFHGGYSHVFAHDTVVAVDYTHYLGRYGWRNLDINPLLNGVRPLAADLQRVYNDPNLLGIINVVKSINRGLYDEVSTHFERRFSGVASIQANYTLAWARGMGGVTDGSTGVTVANVVNPQTANADGGDVYAPWEFGPTSFDERHRVTVAGIFNLPFGMDVSPSFTAASARPYTQFRGNNPSGDGLLMVLDENGNPAGVNNARGIPLINANARVTKNIAFGQERRISLFAEFYNLFNRANFGNQYLGNAFSPATYNRPSGYLGGSGAVSTIPNSFQVQFGARLSF